VLRKPEKQLRTMPQVVEARKREVQGLYDSKCLEWATWQDAERDRVKPIRTGFVDAIKVDEGSGQEKYKSRLVIYGNQMIPFQHFSPYETSSPVAQHIFLLTLCSLLVAINALIKHIDFSQAYSHADMQEICYAIPPDDCKMQDRPNMIWRVMKALYGSPQAGRRWYDHISRYLRQLGYTQSTVDACVFFLKGEAGVFPPKFAYDERSLPWIVLLRTDDMLVFCMKGEQHAALVKKLQEARFRFTDKGDVEVFCGMQFKRFETGLLIHQQAYIDGLLQDRGFANAKPATTPCTDQEPQPADETATLRQWPLRKLAGELIWLF